MMDLRKCRLSLLATVMLIACSSDPASVDLEVLEYDPAVITETTVGQEVTFALEVRNPTAREVLLSLPHGKFSFDPIVTPPGSQDVIWRRWNGIVVDLPTERVVLPAGGSHTFSVTWDLRDRAGEPVEPGEYLVHYSLVVEPYLTVVGEAQFSLTVRPE